MVKIGLEIHLKLLLDKKLFCNCSAFEACAKDKNTCEVCTGEPGALPNLNETALEKAVLAANLLKCSLPARVQFWRKHYVYRDLPKGYQITTLEGVGSGGFLRVYDGYRFLKQIGISRVILEEDPAKTKKTDVDYNRCGTGLLEVVTEPQLSCQREAVSVVKTLVNMMAYAGIIDKHVRNAFRADVNISTPNCARVELKNLGSLQEIQKAIVAEAERQSREPSDEMETREYVPVLNTTRKLRGKEAAVDYRYLREPNIRPRPVYKSGELPLSNYDWYEKHLKTLTASRAWAYANVRECNQVLGALKGSPTQFRKLDLCKRYCKGDKAYPPLAMFNQDTTLVDFTTFLTGRHETGVRLQDVLKTCLQIPQFRSCWNNPNRERDNYVIGQLIRRSQKTYPEVRQYIDKCRARRE